MDKTAITFELNTGGSKWSSRTFTIPSWGLGQVLKEMKRQPEVRNITYLKV